MLTSEQCYAPTSYKPHPHIEGYHEYPHPMQSCKLPVAMSTKNIYLITQIKDLFFPRKMIIIMKVSLLYNIYGTWTPSTKRAPPPPPKALR